MGEEGRGVEGMGEASEGKTEPNALHTSQVSPTVPGTDMSIIGDYQTRETLTPLLPSFYNDNIGWPHSIYCRFGAECVCGRG